MSTQHSVITDPNIHEPKGISTANANDCYVADGLGSGAWTPVQLVGYAKIYGNGTTATTAISTSYQPLSSATLGGNLAHVESITNNFTTNTSSAYLQNDNAGVFEISARGNFVPSTNPSSFTFSLGIDTGSGITSLDPDTITIISTTGTTATYNFNLITIKALPANAKVYILIKEASGNECIVTHTCLIANRVT